MWLALTGELDVRVRVDDMVEDLGRPWSRGVDQRAAYENRRRCGSVECELPERTFALGKDAAEPGIDAGAVCAGVHRVQDHEPGIVDPAIGIFERHLVVLLEGGPPRSSLR